MNTINALVVDDSRVMRLMVMRALNRMTGAQWSYTEANDGSEALELFKKARPDFAFVDWNMPNMSGIDFVRAVRALGDTEHIPLVMVTSEQSLARVEEAMSDAGANAYICKPFADEDLASRISPLIEYVLNEKASGGILQKLFG
jgi:two-component system, chemotaxis family, chemotaxis protein CheY